jgi:hypothetical protein
MMKRPASSHTVHSPRTPGRKDSLPDKLEEACRSSISRVPGLRTCSNWSFAVTSRRTPPSHREKSHGPNSLVRALSTAKGGEHHASNERNPTPNGETNRKAGRLVRGWIPEGIHANITADPGFCELCAITKVGRYLGRYIHARPGALSSPGQIAGPEYLSRKNYHEGCRPNAQFSL